MGFSLSSMKRNFCCEEAHHCKFSSKSNDIHVFGENCEVYYREKLSLTLLAHRKCMKKMEPDFQGMQDVYTP